MKIKGFIILAVVAVLAAVTSGCGHVEVYGERISNREITPLKEILSRPQDYSDKTVTVKGKIKSECETGCWFNLEDSGGVIYIDLQPGGFAIPQNVGKSATVEGKIVLRDGKPTLSGKAAEVR